MDNFDLELARLRDEITRSQQLRARLNSMHPQREYLAEQEAELRAAREEEDGDVERLEGRSLARYFYSIAGSLDERLDRERAEARAAAVKHDAVRRELEDLEEDILSATSELDMLRGCEKRYEDAVNRKAEALKSTGTPAGERLKQLERELMGISLQRRETEEACQAGERAEAAAIDAVNSLSEAGDLGTLDMFTDSLLVNLAKRDRIDCAQSDMERLRVAMRRFNTELGDLGTSLSIDIDGFLGFADLFFDNIFVDIAVNSRIDESRRNVNEALRRIRGILGRLRPALEQLRRRESELNAEYERIVVGA